MAMTRWAPERMRSFDRFSKMMEEVFGTGEEFRGVWSPTVDVKETPKELIFIAELPGLVQKDIDVEMNGDILTIRGVREALNETEKENYVRIERSFGTFQRSFTLDVPVKPDKIDAVYKDGILTVTVPKSESALPRKVSIKPH